MYLTENRNRAYWCKKCQVPVIGKTCFSCHSSTVDISSSNLSPVYNVELGLIEEKFKSILPVIKLKDFEFWVSTPSNIYFLNGEKCFKLKGYSKAIQNLSCDSFSNDFLVFLNRSKEELIYSIQAANEHYIKELEYEAINFIQKTTGKYKELTPIVSFSGGKDSTVVSHLVMKSFGRSDILHVFADTTLEFPDTYEYIKDFQLKHPLTPFIICKSPLNFYETAKSIGVPSRIQRWCCTTHKTNPLAKILNTINPQKGVLTFDGVRKSESNRRSKYNRITTQQKIGREILASPINEWSDIELWIYVIYNGLHINSAYKKGFRRVGCLYCPFNSGWSELMINQHYPNSYQQWQQFLYKYAEETGHPNPESYSRHGWRVRAGGRGLDNYKTLLESFSCDLSEDAFFYQLLNGDIKDIKHFLKPFGSQTFIYQNEYAEAFIINDRYTKEILATVETSFQQNTARITYLSNKNRSLLRKRIEKQIKKLQSCIYCGACSAICPTKANKICEHNLINEKLCISCMRCVSHTCPAVDSLTIRGTQNAKI